MIFLFALLNVICCQYYDPHFSQEFLVYNPGGEQELDFYITLDTKGLIEDGYKMDPYCRDFRLYLNVSVGVEQILEFWFEDKCGTTNETKIWTKLNILGGETARLTVKYGSDYFVEEDPLDYQEYLEANWGIDHDPLNHTNYWDGEFYHLQENQCSEYSEYGQSAYTELNGRILYPRPDNMACDLSDALECYDDPQMLFFDGEGYEPESDAQHHRHHTSRPNSRTRCFEYGDDPVLWENVTLEVGSEVYAVLDHNHGSTTKMSTTEAYIPPALDTAYPPEEIMPSYKTYQFCRGIYNTRVEGMLAITKGLSAIGNNTPADHENVENGAPFGRRYAIRLHESETTQANCTKHGHPGTFTDNWYPDDGTYEEYHCIEGWWFPPRLGSLLEIKEAVSDYVEVANVEHNHTFDFYLEDSDMCGPIYDVGRGIKLYRSQTESLAENYHSAIIHMADKLPPFGYAETSFGAWERGEDEGEGLGILPFVTVPEDLDMSVDILGNALELTIYNGWLYTGTTTGHTHHMVMENVQTYGETIKAEKCVSADWENDCVMVLTNNHVHDTVESDVYDISYVGNPTLQFRTDSLDIYEVENLLNSTRWGQGYPGFMPRYFTRLETEFVVTQLGLEKNLIEGGYQRNSSMDDSDDEETTPPPVGEDEFDFLFVYIGGGAGAAVVGVIGIFCCLGLTVLVCVACCALLVLCILCCGGGVTVLGLSTTLNKQVQELKEEKIKEGAQRQMKIAVEKSKFRQEKKKVDEDLKKKEEEEKEIAKTVTQLEEEKSKVAATMRDARPSSRMNVIEFDEVFQEQKLGKGYLGFKIYKALWKSDTVLFRVFAEKTFKTTRFNIFGMFEDELGEYSSLEHPNVLHYIAYSRLPNVGVVTEYCENATLPIYFRFNGLTFEEKVDIVSKIVEGMYYLHQRGVIHRDLQAGNIFLTEDLTPKVDFGFNRTFNKKYERSQYAAPELINPQSIPDDDDELPNHEKFDVKCDVFSFGILMYEIAMAEEGSDYNFNPYEVQDKKEKIAVKVSQDPELRPDFEGKGAEEIPNWYINLAQMCWVHKAQERPSFERIKNILKNVSSMGDGSESSSSGTETEDSD